MNMAAVKDMLQSVPFACLSVCSLVIIVSHSIPKASRVFFQSGLFALSLALACAHLSNMLYENKLDLLISTYNSFLVETKVALCMLVISASYFGGGMYLAAPDIFGGGGSGAGEVMPASSDKTTTFNVPTTALPKDDTEVFKMTFETICEEIVADLPTVYEMPEEAVEWVQKMIKYTVDGGKMNRGLTTMAVQKTLTESKGRKMSSKERIQSAALGWCIEFLQAFFLVADDLMDSSPQRRGQPCWYKLPQVKLIAINDSFILESCVFKILKRYFGREPYYLQLLDLFIEVTRQTELGQLLDLTSQPQDSPLDFSRFTMDRLSSIFKYKTAFYSFYLPVALGMIVAGETKVHLYDKAREILCVMGEYFQIQDDYLDCFGTFEMIGKVGTDIQDAKCSWLVVTALQKCNSKQRKVLQENYGKHDPRNIEAVKKLYRDLNMTQLFNEYEEESYEQIQALLNTSTELPREVFEFLLKRIYKRSK